MKKTLALVLSLIMMVFSCTPIAFAEEGESRLVQLPDGRLYLEAEELTVTLSIPDGWIFFGQDYEEYQQVYDSFFEDAENIAAQMQEGSIHLFGWPDAADDSYFFLIINKNDFSEKIGELDLAGEDEKQQARQLVQEENKDGLVSLKQFGEHTLLFFDFGSMLVYELIHNGTIIDFYYKDTDRTVTTTERAVVEAVAESIRFDETVDLDAVFSQVNEPEEEVDPAA